MPWKIEREMKENVYHSYEVIYGYYKHELYSIYLI